MTAGYVSFKVHIDIFVCVRCWSRLHFKVTSLTRLVLFDVRQQRLCANCFETVSNLCRAWLYRMDEVKSAPKFATTCTNKCGRPFGHNRHGPKRGRCAPFRGEGAGSPSNTMWLGLRSTCIPSSILIHPAIWPQQAWAENWGAWSPSNTMWPGSRPTSMPGFISIHTIVLLQYTNVPDRQDNGPIA